MKPMLLEAAIDLLLAERELPGLPGGFKLRKRALAHGLSALAEKMGAKDKNLTVLSKDGKTLELHTTLAIQINSPFALAHIHPGDVMEATFIPYNTTFERVFLTE